MGEKMKIKRSDLIRFVNPGYYMDFAGTGISRDLKDITIQDCDLDRVQNYLMDKKVPYYYDGKKIQVLAENLI
jgi:hypothetical protein